MVQLVALQLYSRYYKHINSIQAKLPCVKGFKTRMYDKAAWNRLFVNGLP